VVLYFIGCTSAFAQEKADERSLIFVKGEAESFSFNTKELKGIFRLSGKSTGLFPVIYKPHSTMISSGNGLFNHYRVFTLGKRYGYGARLWSSTAELQPDGSVEVFWLSQPDRPFELLAKYKWVTPNILDLITVVNAKEKLESFEVFLASYFDSTFTDSRVYAMVDQSGDMNEVFVSADQELGEWLAFPRDDHSARVIIDGRWDMEPHPIEWTMMSEYNQPVAFRRDTLTGVTVVMMTRKEDCFGVFTPYGYEKHYSTYFSLFGYDIEKDSTATAHSRLVFLHDPSEEEILKIADAFLK
jgi:hypothetical protein